MPLKKEWQGSFSMRVLLTHSYLLHFDPKQLKSATPYPPLATLYAASLLRQNGFDVALADLQFSASAKEIEGHIKTFKPHALVIYDDGFNYLTKMCLSNMRQAAFEMQAAAKKCNVPVIVSGSDATDHADQYFSNGADYIIEGEAEFSLLGLLQSLRDKKEPEKIFGIVFWKNGAVFKTPSRPVSRQLDQLPFPAWDLVNIEAYKNIWLRNHNYFSVNLVTTRGCPYKCNWCAKPIYGNRYNSHSPQYVVNMIKRARGHFAFDHIWFADDIFGLKPGWLREFSELLDKEKISIKYKIQSRADLLLEEENIIHLAKSGCETVWMGAESGSQKILDAMDKGITVEQIRKAVNLLKQHGIKPALFLQFGYLDEKMEDIRQTVDLLRELKPYDIGVSVSYPLPGTKFYEKVKAQLKEKSNWTDSDDLHLMFNNTYPAEFYRHLHRYVHHTFRAAQAEASLRSFSLGDYRKIGLWPWYKLRGMKEKNILKRIEPLAGSIL
jgi:radical SAM superfamily enzyme YgiQ (UPF0313 family)